MEQIKFINGQYKTEQRKVKCIYKVLTSFSFFLICLPVIIDSSRKAKRNMYGDKEWVDSSLKIKNNLEKVGIEFDIEGADNFINLSGPCIFAANHMSTLETFILPSLIQPHRAVTFVVKKELIEVPVFKHVMKSRNPVVVGRSNPREDLIKVIEDGREKLKSGISIIIFPQTTRMVQFDPEEFNSIAVKLAKRAEVPIIPLALKTDAWLNGKIIKDFGIINPKQKVHFSFGEPIYIQNRGNEEHQQIINFIQKNLEKWKDS